jgi:flagellar protein FliO/FliZ
VLELVLRVVFSLSVVLGLLWLIARVSSRRLRGSAHQGLVRTLVRQPLSRGSSLAVVSVGERVLVVGVTEQQVNLLTELDPSELDVEPAVAEITGPAEQPGRRKGGRRKAVPEQPGGADGAAGSSLGGPLGGSVLSSQTWKQAFAAATKRHGDRS